MLLSGETFEQQTKTINMKFVRHHGNHHETHLRDVNYTAGKQFLTIRLTRIYTLIISDETNPKKMILYAAP